MRSSSPNFFPSTLPFLLGFLVLVAFVFALLQIGMITYAYEKMGIGRQHVFSLLIFSLLGSYVNIPVSTLPAETVLSDQVVSFFGMRHVIPIVKEWPRTIIAVNLGGAVIPTVLSLYLILENGIYLQGLLGAAIVAAVVLRLARPVAGVGIAVPMFIPPLLAAGVGLMLSRTSAPALAYVAGSLGTLIGADVLNLGKLRGLGAPVASIGGAGTFDGIFLTGILAVLLA
jgi:uncharacterized membrane protein